jgi:hypothetical protein
MNTYFFCPWISQVVRFIVIEGIEEEVYGYW